MSAGLYELARTANIEGQPSAELDMAAAMLKDLWESQDKIRELERQEFAYDPPATRETDLLYWKDHEDSLIKRICLGAVKIPGVVDIARGLHKAEMIIEGHSEEDIEAPEFNVASDDFFTQGLYERDCLITGLRVVIEQVHPEADSYLPNPRTSAASLD